MLNFQNSPLCSYPHWTDGESHCEYDRAVQWLSGLYSVMAENRPMLGAGCLHTALGSLPHQRLKCGNALLETNRRYKLSLFLWLAV